MQNGNENIKIYCILKLGGNGLVMTKMQNFDCFNAKYDSLNGMCCLTVHIGMVLAK